MPRGWLGTLLLVALARSSVACGTDAVGVDACRQIQQARCRQAPACGIAAPNHTSGTDVDACIRFYNDACLHGLSIGSDPGPASVNACVDAINRAPQMDGGCAVVAAPEVAAECSWLTPPAAADASSESPTEAAIDAPSE
jgi:hypothetical protein